MTPFTAFGNSTHSSTAAHSGKKGRTKQKRKEGNQRTQTSNGTPLCVHSPMNHKCPFALFLTLTPLPLHSFNCFPSPKQTHAHTRTKRLDKCLALLSLPSQAVPPRGEMSISILPPPICQQQTTMANKGISPQGTRTHNSFMRQSVINDSTLPNSSGTHVMLHRPACS